MQRDITPRREPELRPVHREREGFTDLLRQLADETASLVRQEVNLARLEMKETASAFAKDAVRLGIATGLVAAGALALTACLILVVGNLLNGAYWAGALIVGAVLLLIGGLMARSAVKDMKRIELKPEETIETLGEDKRWLQREAQDFRRAAMS